MTRLRLFAMAVLATLTACAAPIAGTPAASVTLPGTSWVVTQIGDKTVQSDAPPTMSFKEGQVSGSTGCNRYFGPVTITGSKVSIGQVGSTQMACEQPLMDQEQRFLTALASVTTAQNSGTGLELLDASGAVVLKLAPPPVVTPKPLTGTTWTLTTFVKGDVAESPVADTSITMRIDGDQLSGKACNSYGGTVTQDGSSFKVGPLRSTKMACPGDGVMEQEARYLALLQSVTSMTLDEAGLTLTAPDGQALVYVGA